MTCAPTIVILDNNTFHAQRFYACIDQQVVLAASSSEEAFMGLIHAAFIFEAHYPTAMKHTFEYLERVVCRLGNLTMLKDLGNDTTSAEASK